MKFEIRPARAEDIGWLLGQLRKFSDFYGSSVPLFPSSEDHAVTYLMSLIYQHLFLIAESETTGPVGFISGVFTPHIMNPEIRVLAESFWWVDEEHRGSRAGIMLLDEFVAVGKSRADWVLFTLEHKSPVKDETLLKRGFKLQEKSFLLEVQ